MTTKVVKICDGIIFEDGSDLSDHHEQDCCESHYLSYDGLSLSDFEGMEFDLSSDSFFERVPDYGIRLIPVSGHPVSIPGYGYNNGYYTSNLSLILARPGEASKTFDISECQEQHDC